MTRDPMRSPQFRITHEFLSGMLGVRRVACCRCYGLLTAAAA